MNFKKYIVIMFAALCVFGCSAKKSGFGTDLTVVPEDNGFTEDTHEALDDPDTEDMKTVSDNEINGSVEIGNVTVYVCGEVNCSGVYTLPAGSRICDAVEAAGGLTGDACETCINLADFLYDGQMVDILSVDEASSFSYDSATLAGDDNASGGLININTADAAALKTLPGIGDSKATAIISYRQEHGLFTSIEDIMKIDGIKEGIFNNIKDYITV